MQPRPSIPFPGSQWLERFQDLSLGSYGKFMLSQPMSFWLICIYLLFEYVRPQSIYPALSTLPWPQMVLLGCLVAVIVEGRLVAKNHMGDRWLLVFTAVVIASSVNAFDPRLAWEDIYIYLTWVAIYWMISVIVTTTPRFFVFMGLFLLASLKMSQHATRSWLGDGFAFRDWGAVGAPGWFHNSGEMAIQMAIFLALSVYLALALRPRWKRLGVVKLGILAVFPATALIAILASSSRGGQIAGVVVIAFMVFRSRHRARGMVLGGVVAALLVVALPAEQMERFRNMGEDETSIARLAVWQDGFAMAADHPFLGVGYENWTAYHLQHFPPVPLTSTRLSHNIFIQALGELGYVGLAAFVMLIIVTFRMNAQTRRWARGSPDGRYIHHMALGLDAALVGYMASGFFVTVLFYPYFWVNLAMTSALFRIAKKQASGAGRAGRPNVPARGRPGAIQARSA